MMLELGYSPPELTVPAATTGTKPLASSAPNWLTKSGRPHICFVAPEAWPVFSGNTEISVVGGAEVQQSILARLLAQAGYRVSMICLDYGQAPRIMMDGVTVHRAYRTDAGLAGLRFIYPRLTSMWQLMKEVDADIYYQRTASMLTGVVAAFCRRHNKRSIYAGASDPDFLPGRQDIRYRRDRWLFERGLAMVDRLVAQNTTQQQRCLDNYARHSVIIPSCYELPENTVSGPRNSLLWVGTISRNKRPELLLELAKRLPQFKFIMVGGPSSTPSNGSYFDTIRQAAGALPNLEFKGFLPLSQVEPYFDRAAILINTSSHEGVPTTFLQAWARGIPTVAFVDIGARLQGLPVYPVVREIDDAALEIEQLFANEIYRHRAAARCLEYFSKTHSPAGILAKYENLFAELVQQGTQ